MKEIHFCPLRFMLIITCAGAFLALSTAAFAQGTPIPQPTAVWSAENTPASEQHTALAFDGKITRSGSKLVLSTPDAIYQLDDQQRAHSFVNQNVKILGILDPAKGMIQVQSIGAKQSAD